MPKKLKSFRLSDEAIKQLEMLSKKQDRSEAYIIEQLILSTKKRKGEQ